MNGSIASQGDKFMIRSEYAIECLEKLMAHYINLTGYNPETAIRGRGRRKTSDIFIKISYISQKIIRDSLFTMNL